MHPENQPMLDELVGHAVVYYQEKVVATKRFRPPTEQEKAAFEALIARLRVAPQEDAHGLQTLVYEIGNAFFPVVKDWFDAFYQVLFGQQSGPRVGSFIALYGKEDTCALIESRLK
jgi:lysyl-tRNA synthetase class 1